MPFDFNNIGSVMFGVCLDNETGEFYRIVPSERNVQNALKEMLAKTKASLDEGGVKIPEFSPAEKYAANECLRVPLTSDWAQKYQEVFATENLDTDTHGLDSPEKLVSYFGVFRDRTGGKLMAFTAPHSSKA